MATAAEPLSLSSQVQELADAGEGGGDADETVEAATVCRLGGADTRSHDATHRAHPEGRNAEQARAGRRKQHPPKVAAMPSNAPSPRTFPRRALTRPAHRSRRCSRRRRRARSAPMTPRAARRRRVAAQQ